MSIRAQRRWPPQPPTEPPHAPTEPPHGEQDGYQDLGAPPAYLEPNAPAYPSRDDPEYAPLDEPADAGSWASEYDSAPEGSAAQDSISPSSVSQDTAPQGSGPQQYPPSLHGDRPVATIAPPSGSRWRTLRGPLATTLAAAGLIAAIWLAPVATLDGAAEAIEWLRARNHETGRAVLTTVIVAAALLAYVLAWARRSSHRRSVRLPGEGGALPLGDLAALITDTLREHPDVEDARVRLQNRHRRGLAIDAEVLVAPHAQLDDVAAFARDRVLRCLDEQIGVAPAGTPRIRLRYRELNLRRSMT